MSARQAQETYARVLALLAAGTRVSLSIDDGGRIWTFHLGADWEAEQRAALLDALRRAWPDGEGG